MRKLHKHNQYNWTTIKTHKKNRVLLEPPSRCGLWFLSTWWHGMGRVRSCGQVWAWIKSHQVFGGWALYKSVPYCEQTIRKTVKICQCLQVKICKFYQETNTFMIKSLGVHKCWDKQICSSQYSAKPFTLSPRPGLSGRTSQLGIEAHPKFSKVYPPWWSCLKNGILG